MDVDEVLSGNVLLPPIQFSYESDVWVYPFSGALNSIGKQDIVLHTITDFDDGAVGVSNYPEFEVGSVYVARKCVGRLFQFYDDQYAKLRQIK